MTQLKHPLSQKDIVLLNQLNSDMLSAMFEEKIANIATLPAINNLVQVTRPAYGDVITITVEEQQVAAKMIAYSTLNQQASACQQLKGNMMPLYALGFSQAQIDNSGDNYHTLSQVATDNVYRILD